MTYIYIYVNLVLYRYVYANVRSMITYYILQTRDGMSSFKWILIYMYIIICLILYVYINITLAWKLDFTLDWHNQENSKAQGDTTRCRRKQTWQLLITPPKKNMDQTDWLIPTSRNMSASCIVYRVADRSFLWRTIPSLQQLSRQRSHVTASCVHIIRVLPRMRPLRHTQSRLMVINFSSFCTTSCPSFGHTFVVVSLLLCNLLLTSCRNEDWGTGCKCRHFGGWRIMSLNLTGAATESDPYIADTFRS